MKLITIMCIEYSLASNTSLYIATMNVDTVYDEIKNRFPNAKLKKDKGGVIVEKS